MSPWMASPGRVPQGATFSTKWPTMCRDSDHTSFNGDDMGRPEKVRLDRLELSTVITDSFYSRTICSGG
jgi:hypothetical protein